MAANNERGEISLLVEGKRYVLTLPLNSMVELEDMSGGRTFLEAWRGIQEKHSVRDVMLMMWTALRERHPEIATDGPGALKRIATFVDQAGGLPAVNEQLTAFLKLHAQPIDLQPGGPERPPDAPGIESSASPGAASGSRPSDEG